MQVKKILVNGREVECIRTDFEACDSRGKFTVVWSGDDGKAYRLNGSKLVPFEGFALAA